MRTWKAALAGTALALGSLLPATAMAQFTFTPANPRGAPSAPGGSSELWSGSRNFTPQIDFLRFDSNSRERWYPSYSYDGGRTFTRDPGAFSGRRDRAHAARVMTAQEFRAHQELANWEPGPGVILVRGETTGAVGLTYGVFRDGRWVLAEGSAGAISLDVLRAEGGLAGDVQLGRDGLMANGNAEARITVVGVHGQTSTGRVGGSGLGADISASGRAGVGAEAEATGTLALGPNGLRARLGGEAFAGAKASGEVPVGVSLLGIRFAATGRGHVSAGAGVNGNAYAGLGNGGVRAGCELGGCLGVGAGAGVDLEIDASGLIDFFDNLGSGGSYMPREDFRPRIVGSCGPGMYRVSTVNCIGSRTTQVWSESQVQSIRDRERQEFQSLASFFANPRSGTQAPRYSNTRLSDTELQQLRQWLQTAPSSSGTAAPAGMGRD